MALYFIKYKEDTMTKKVAILMGSDSDLPVVKGAINTLKEFGVASQVHIMSAHRTPNQACEFATNAKSNGFGVIICAAGKAAHLAGVIAAHTILPVIGIPMKSSTLDGLDALLSTVQMPKGIPVATVAIDGAENAALLALSILAVSDEDLATKIQNMRTNMTNEVIKKDEKLQLELS
jgi:5-(carboxyamino)imidazole ribonucleotide mutase